jgi:hypothetical protein
MGPKCRLVPRGPCRHPGRGRVGFALMLARVPKPAFLGAAFAAAALLVAAAPLASAAPPAAQSRAAAPACKTSQLVIWLFNGQGTAGSFFYELNFTNLSNSTCTMRGYPKAFGVDLQGKRVGLDFADETGKQKLVTLPGGGSETATATLRLVDPGAFSSAECHPTKIAGIRVTPPGQSASKVVPFPSETCAREPTESAASVGPVGPLG